MNHALHHQQLKKLQASADKIRKRFGEYRRSKLTAIEAFVEMKKRYEFILEQNRTCR